VGDRTDFARTDRPATAQPPPVFRPGAPVVHQVVAEGLMASGHTSLAVDLLARGAFGVRKYNCPLQPGNGRRALPDAYEEGLDQIAYIGQDELERAADGLPPRHGDLLARAIALAEDIRTAMHPAEAVVTGGAG
jgi:hypothetical protein